jgi:hypothetical protein
MKKIVGLWLVPAVLVLGGAGPRQPQPRHEVTHPARAAVKGRASTQQSAEVMKAQAELEAVEKRMRAEFEAGEDFQKADAALKQAQGEYDAAEKGAVEKLKERPEYKAALEAQAKVEDDVATARLNPAAKPDPELATRLMDARMAVRKLEADAGDADPAVKAAQQKVQAAKEVVGQMRGKFDEQMRGNAEWQEKKKALDEARAQARRG